MVKYYTPGGASGLTRVKNGSVHLANALSKSGRAAQTAYRVAKPRVIATTKRVAAGAREVKRRADAYEAKQQKTLRKTRKRYEKDVKSSASTSRKSKPRKGNPYADQLSSFGRF